MDGRRLRRVAGLLNARLPELDLEAVPDPRAREDRWSIGQILRATLVGLMAGCRSLWEAEDLTDRLSRPMRKMLGLPRRLADTTARDALCRVPLEGLRAALHQRSLRPDAPSRVRFALRDRPDGDLLPHQRCGSALYRCHPHPRSDQRDGALPGGLRKRARELRSPLPDRHLRRRSAVRGERSRRGGG